MVIDVGTEQCKIGDTYDFHFKVRNNFIGLPKAVLTYLVDRQEKFEVESSLMDADGNLVVRAKVVQNPLPFLVVFAVIVGGSSLLLWTFGITLDKVEKVVSTPAGAAVGILAGGTTLVTVIAGLFILYKFFQGGST
jgi:hypothetical protein